MVDTINEIDACAQLKVSMEQRLKRVTEKLELNETRLQVREANGPGGNRLHIAIDLAGACGQGG